MIRKILTLVLALVALTASAQYTFSYTKAEQQQAAQWARRSAPWTRGFTKGKPGWVNLAEMRQQYSRNRKQWDALFRWLERTDLDTLKAGKYAIPGTTMTASVQDDTNKPLAKRRSESHRRNIDFQFVLRGTEGFEILNQYDNTTQPNCKYDAKKDVIHYDYDPAKARHLETTGPVFNIFFPGDWHVAKTMTKKNNQKFRVLVVKVEYKG